MAEAGTCAGFFFEAINQTKRHSFCSYLSFTFELLSQPFLTQYGYYQGTGSGE
jgi:hypothetical protein